MSIELWDHLADRRRVEVEIVDLAIHGVTEVMVDVDHRAGQHGIARALDLGALHRENSVIGVGIVVRQGVRDRDLGCPWYVVERFPESIAYADDRLFSHL